MGNEVAARSGTSLAAFQIPDDVAAILAGEEGNIAQRVTVNSLNTAGKGTWVMNVNGEKKVLERKNAEGDMELVSTIRVIILGYNRVRERGWYETPFDPANPRAPDCWSKDGRKPDVNSPMPQANACDTCPMAAKGSRQSDDGKSGVACSQHRTLVVIPEKTLEFPALKMRISVTSDWDKQDPEAEAQGWYGFGNYADMLRAGGAQHTFIMSTRMRFDPKVRWPKIQFGRGDMLPASTVKAMLERSKSDEVQGLLNETWSAQSSSRGRALPAPLEPAGDPVFSQSGRGAEAAQAAESARLKAEAAVEAAKAATAQAAADQAARDAAAKIAADNATKAAKAAALRAQLAALEAAEADAQFDNVAAPPPPTAAFDDTPTAPAPAAAAEPPKRTRAANKPKETPVAPPPPQEAPDNLKEIMGAWG